jgi:hypothetical protein
MYGREGVKGSRKWREGSVKGSRYGREGVNGSSYGREGCVYEEC